MTFRLAGQIVAVRRGLFGGMAAGLFVLSAVVAVRAERPGIPGTHGATTHHSFEDVDHWVAVFDDPNRDEWQKPGKLIEALDLRPGMRAADLGAGTGYFSRYLSAAVGEAGAVFAIDIEPKLVRHIRERAEREGTANVVPVLASRDNPRLPAGILDLVLIVNTYHHLDDRLVYLRNLRAVLAPGGRVAVVDWRKHRLPVGPKPGHKIARGHVLDEMKDAGYELVAEPSLLPYQYFLIFKAGGEVP